MDSKRRFLEAASRYYELSSLSGRTIGGAAVSEDDVTTSLRAAITCTVLAAVGRGRRGWGVPLICAPKPVCRRMT